MVFIKRYDNVFRFLIFVLVIALVQSVINLLFNFSTTINQFISLILIGMFVFVESFKKGKKTDNGAYKVGLANGFIYILVLYALGLPFLLLKITLKRFIYFVIIEVICVLGSILGINKKTR